MEERYDSILFEPIDDKGILEGMVLWTLNKLGLDEEGLAMFRREFERSRDLYVMARESGDAAQVDKITKQALKYVPKYAHLATLETNIDLAPNVWLDYVQEGGWNAISRARPCPRRSINFSARKKRLNVF